MKYLLAFLAFTATAAVFAAEPSFRVDEFGGVFKDDQNTNMDVADYIANNPSDEPLVAGAFRARVVTARQGFAAQVAAKEVEKQAAITAAQDSSAAQAAAKDATIAEREATIAAKDAYIEALKAQLVALGAAPIDPPAAPGN